MLTISVKVRFAFGSHQAFREPYERFKQRPDAIIVDLKEATFGGLARADGRGGVGDRHGGVIADHR